MDLVKRVAIVTGASRGIGLAIAEALIARGARVVGLARDARRLQNLVGRLGNAFFPLVCDVGITEEVAEAVRTTQRTLGSPDILINNAGVGRFGPVDELSLHDWDEMLATNISGLFHCVRHAAPMMKARRHGHIVNVASIAGKVAYPNASGYNATKFAVRGMSKALADELEAFGIKVTSIYPGATDTAFGSGRPGPVTMRPEEVAEAVVFCLERSDTLLITEMVMRPLRYSG